MGVVNDFVVSLERRFALRRITGCTCILQVTCVCRRISYHLATRTLQVPGPYRVTVQRQALVFCAVCFETLADATAVNLCFFVSGAIQNKSQGGTGLVSRLIF